MAHVSKNAHFGTEVRTRSHMNGWVSFAGYLMIVAGFFHAIAGLVALFKPSLYVASANSTLVFTYTGWGWLHIVFGAVLMAAGTALFSGKMWARILAITLATLSAIANFGFIWAYPLWSIIIIIMDVIIIYSVAVNGAEYGYGNEDFDDNYYE